jgi:hypothetical protein
MHWVLFLACELRGCGRYIFGQMVFRISVFAWRRKQFYSEAQCAVLSIFVTTEKVIVNGPEISSITTGFPLVLLTPFMQQLVLSQKLNTTACAHFFSNR